jgi:hypothetical protein
MCAPYSSIHGLKVNFILSHKAAMSLTISPYRKVPFELNTEYPLREFFLKKELPQKGAVLRISSSDNVSNEIRSQYIVFSHSKDTWWGVVPRFPSSMSVQRIFGLEFSCCDEFQQLMRKGKNFQGQFVMAEIADTTEQEERPGVPKTSYAITVMSNDYFADLGKWFQQVEASLLPVLPNPLISCIREYAPYEPCDTAFLQDSF